MATQTEANQIHDIIKAELPFGLSRRVLTLEDSNVVTLGEVMEPGSSANTIKVLGTAANATAIALEAVTTSGATADILCLVKNARVDTGNLTYNGEAVAATDAGLADEGIHVV